MSDALLQSAWLQAKSITPRRNPAMAIFCRQYRGEQWYVLQRKGSERLHRINPTAWFILSHCDGINSLDVILTLHRQQPIDNHLNELELLKIINQFVYEGVLWSDHAGAEQRKATENAWRSYFKNPMAIRIPLWNPSRFLARYAPFAKALTHPLAAYTYLFIILAALVQLIVNWSSISGDVIDQVMRPDNWLWLWLMYPLTKFFHEMGHAFATHLQGGTVQETGIVIMYGVPLPYVDASSASAFPNKRQRLLVDAAGILVELLLAALALFVWLNVADGLVRQLAYNVMIICSVSTLFFNANPLMRFDGYYVLADWLEMPALASRSSLYWRYLFKRYLFRLSINPFSADANERRWLMVYGCMAYIYRWFIIAVITLLAAQQSLLLGVVLAVWLLTQQLVKPCYQLIVYLRDDALEGQRRQAISGLLMSIVALMLVLLVLPVPNYKTAEAVVWLPEQTRVRAATDGQIIAIKVESGQPVVKGQLLFEFSDPYLATEHDIAVARHREVTARLNLARVEDPVEAEQLEEEQKTTLASLKRLEQRLSHLEVKSESAGVFYLPPSTQLLRRYVEQGALLGYVLQPGRPLLRVLVDQNDFSLISGETQGVSVWFGQRPLTRYKGEIVRFFPSATHTLPSAALSSFFGGSIAVDPSDSTGLTSIDEWFELEVQLDGHDESGFHYWPGSRVQIRFDVGAQPVAWQFYRELRQLFLQKLVI